MASDQQSTHWKKCGESEALVADIVRRDLFPEPRLSRIQHALDRLAGSVLDWPQIEKWTEPPSMEIDVSEQEGQLRVEVSLPGFAKDDITLEVGEDYVSISAKHEEEKEESGKHYYHRERRMGSVSRRIPVAGVDSASEVDATFKDGVLTVTLPRSEEAKPKQVEVKSD